MKQTTVLDRHMTIKAKIFFAVILALLLAGFAAAPVPVFAYDDTYTITHMDVVIDVGEDNVYHVTETIDVNYQPGAGKHGIIRSVPLSNAIYREDGSTDFNSAKISNITVNAPYTTYDEDGYKNIRIGSADVIVEGDMQYQITYDYDIGRDRLKDADEFYYNIVGTEWDTTVESVSFAVHFPKEFKYNEQSLGFTHGYAYSSAYEGVSYKVENDTVYGEYNAPLAAYEGLTMRLTLPDGYFVRETTLMEGVCTGLLGIPFLSFLATLLLYFTRMRNKKPLEPVEFYPPDGLSPLWIGYYYDGKVDTKDITSLLIWLGSKGYLKIHERSPKDYDIILLQDYYPEEDKQAYTFLDGLRRLAKENKLTGEIYVTRDDLEKKFYRTVDKIRSSMNTRTNRKQYLVEGGAIKRWTAFFGTVSVIVSLYSIFYFGTDDSFLAGFFTAVPAVFIVVVMVILHANSEQGSHKIILVTMLAIIGIQAVVCLVIYFVLGGSTLFDWSLWQTKAGMAGVVLGVLACFLSLRMHKRTEKANELLGRIRGFKRFLEMAEKPRLEMLVAESPSYFYDILPYTYVLGISDKWIRKFDSIAMKPPGWYYTGWDDGSGATWAGRDLDKTMSRMRRDLTSAPASSGGSSGGWSSSSSGGGWSSSGSSGGGSSGGGSGGGGGHSW